MESVTPIRAQREKIEQGMLAKFGEAFEKAAQAAQAIADPGRRALGAARIALEHAVLQTAIERDMPTKAVASMLEKASPQQVAEFIRHGRKKVAEHYGVQADAMVAALSAQVANVDLPKTMVQTEAMRQLIDQGRAYMQDAVAEAYQSRGRFTHDFGVRSEILVGQQSGKAITARDQLQNHLVFVEAAIDYAVRSGTLQGPQAQMLKERVEHQIFHPPDDKRLTPQFMKFYDATAKEMRTDMMREARRVVNDKTVGEIAARLHDARARVQQLRAGADR